MGGFIERQTQIRLLRAVDWKQVNKVTADSFNQKAVVISA